MTMFSKRTKVYSLEFILDKVAALTGLSADVVDALNGANTPSAGNVFATMADITAGSGDMLKADYDSDTSGVVDDSELLEGNDGAYYLARVNHTGTQLAATISDFTTTAETLADGRITTWYATNPAISGFTNDSHYITDLSTFDTADLAEGTNKYFTEGRVRATVLTGLSISGGTIAGTDNIVVAFGKLQNQINAVAGGVNYQGVWNATTNSPALASGVGTKGYYYVVNPAGSTSIDGISSWGLGDWIIFNGTVWEKVDNTDAVISVNSLTGAVTLTTANVSDSTNKRYVTDAQLVVIGNTSGTNTGDQTTVVGISGTMAQFNTACSDGDFVYVSTLNELAQDAIGAMVDTTLVYVDGTPLLTRAALTGDVTAAQGSNATTIANDAVTFAKFQNITDARLLGRSAGSSGDMQEITVGTGLTLSSGSLTAEGITQVKWTIITATGSGTYTPTAGMKYVTVYCTGGGGASLDCTNTDAVTGGGGAGGTCIKTYTAAAIGASKGYVVGAGGTRGTVQTQGTATTFDSGNMTANGGFSSAAELAGATVNVGYGGTGGNATGGDMNIDGGSGMAGIIVSTTLGVGGTGGSSFWGGGRCAVGSDTVGLAGISYGSGAAGAHAAGTTDRLGANGANGVIVFVEYI